jgi:hypothetical protein
LFRRRLDELAVTEIAGTNNPTNVVYSPNGQTLAVTNQSRQLSLLSGRESVDAHRR